MPCIHCDVQQALNSHAKQQLVVELTQAGRETIGAPTPYIHVGLSEIPGNKFVESGQVNLSYQAKA